MQFHFPLLLSQVKTSAEWILIVKDKLVWPEYCFKIYFLMLNKKFVFQSYVN